MPGVETPVASVPQARRAATFAAFLNRHGLLLLIALGAALRFGTIGTQSFWLDEQVTLDLVRRSPTDLLKGVVGGESNPALYYVLGGAWERVFGTGEIGFRSLSALLGTATIPVVYAAARELGSRRAGLIAAALVATSPLLIWYSQEARNYILLVFLSAVALWLFARAREGGGRWVWAWALACGLALGTHYFAVFFIAPQLAWLLWRRATRVDAALAGGTVAVVGLALLPLLATQRGRGSWIDNYSFADRLFQVPEHFALGLQSPWPWLPAAFALVLALAAAFAFARASSSSRHGAALALGVFAVGFSLLLAAVVLGEDYLLSRNAIGLWPPLFAGLAVVLGDPGARAIGVTATVAVAVAGSALVVWTAATPEAQRPAYDELAAELEGTGEARLIVSQSSFSSPLIEYLDGTEFTAEARPEAGELVVIEPRETHSYAVGFCFWTATCGGVDVEPPPRFEVPAPFEPVGEGTAGGIDYTVYEAPRPVPFDKPLELFTPRVFTQPPG